jgi:hypothetical protein
MRAAVQALGGAKVVGPMLWPDKSVDNAARQLLDCVNPNRHEKLEITQVMRIFALAKEAGCHSPFEWFAGQVGYDAKPVTRAEEVDRITSVIEQSSKTLAGAIAALERIERTKIRVAATVSA